MFQFPGLAAMHLCIQCMLIQESWAHHLFVGSPKLFADFHAFRRLSIPRHPPCALSNLTIGILNSCEVLIPMRIVFLKVDDLTTKPYDTSRFSLYALV